ncbi:MAG: class I SAM-dependent methyltransferase [Candidatus Eisenbacteria bacterium]|nr:class I SAM-dependent methyltransferase [Candidatus Eisenbacteria bacterium]
MGMGSLDDRVRMSDLLRPEISYERPRGGGRAIFDLLGDLRGKRILDLGCGRGAYRLALERRGATWIGCDLSAGGCMIIADGSSLPFPDGAFDGILSAAVLEHLPDPGAMLDEARRVLRPGGRLFGYVAFLEPLHGMSYFHMTHLGLEYILMRHGFRPTNVFPAENAVPVQIERIMFPKRIPLAQPLSRTASRGMTQCLLLLNRWGREVLTLLRRLPVETRRSERRQYRQLLALRHAAGLNFVAERSEVPEHLVAGYRALVKED